MTYELVNVTTEDDWETYHRIRREELFEARGRQGVYDANHPDDTNPKHINFLLKQDGVGIATTRFDRLDERTAAIRLVAVTKLLQGKGVGRTLAEKTLRFAREQGVGMLVVNSAPTAVGFYERFGFQRESWGTDELVGISSQSVQMVLRLS